MCCTRFTVDVVCMCAEVLDLCVARARAAAAQTQLGAPGDPGRECRSAPAHRTHSLSRPLQPPRRETAPAGGWARARRDLVMETKLQPLVEASDSSTASWFVT